MPLARRSAAVLAAALLLAGLSAAGTAAAHLHRHRPQPAAARVHRADGGRCGWGDWFASLVHQEVCHHRQPPRTTPRPNPGPHGGRARHAA